MATDAIRVTLWNVRNGGYKVQLEAYAGFESSSWRYCHEEVFGQGQEGEVQARVERWTRMLMTGEGQEHG